MKFNDEQETVINQLNGNIAVIATAGSGKTSTLVERILNLVVHGIRQETILAITFSKNAQQNLLAKLEQMGVFHVNVYTFHAFAYMLLKQYYGTEKFRILDSPLQRQILFQESCKKKGIVITDDTFPYNECCNFLATQKLNRIKPSAPLAKIHYSEDMPFPKKDMKRFYSEYEKLKKDYKEAGSNGIFTYYQLIEFDDMVNLVLDLFEEHPDFLKEQQEQYHYILADEYQDVNRPQEAMLHKIGTAHNNVMVVGDPLQAIYAFRGGVSDFMLNFDKEWKDVKIFHLPTNYRCSENIVSLSNHFAESIPEGRDRNYKKAVAFKKAEIEPTYQVYEDEQSEASNIAKIIQSSMKQDNRKYDEFAILTRTNAQLQHIESVFYSQNIPFESVEKSFTQKDEIQLVLNYLRLAENTNDNEAFKKIINKPCRYLGKSFIAELEGKCKVLDMINRKKKGSTSYFSALDEYLKTCNKRQIKKIKEFYSAIIQLKTQMAHTANIGDSIKFLRTIVEIDNFVKQGKVSDDGKSCEQIENLDTFQNLCAEYKTLDKLLNFVKQIDEAQKCDSPMGKVKLMTIHRSKGLEFPTVFIIGCNEGILPHKKNENIDDERRLLYVAITRAEKELFISSTNEYNKQKVKKSSFIDELF